MPTYSYGCRACGHQFDQFQKFSDDPLTVCPECGGEIRRLIHNVGVVFKGSGWYINDSRKSSSSEASASEAGESSTSKTEKPKADKSDKTNKADSAQKEPAKKEPATAAAASD